jgi:hypothetical protein
MSYFPKQTTITDASTNVVESNAIFDADALKANISGQTFTGNVVARGLATTSQANTPAATTYAWVLSSGNSLTLTLTSSTGDVTVTTSAPTANVFGDLQCVGHATLARNVSLTQSGVSWIYNGVVSVTTVLLGSVPATKRLYFELNWLTATLCAVRLVAGDEGSGTLTGVTAATGITVPNNFKANAFSSNVLT